MCLILLNKDAEPEVLEEDLTIFKIMRHNDSVNYYSAPVHLHFSYTPGQLYRTNFSFNREFKYPDRTVYRYLMEHLDEETRKIFVRDTRTYMSDFERIDELSKRIKSVNHGFHACATLGRAVTYMANTWSDNRVIVQCIVPAGAEVYRDDTQLITSNQILVGHIVNKKSF